jgi:putative membrane protein
MRTLLLRFLVSALALYITGHLVHGFRWHGEGATLVAALILGVLNAIIRPILLLLTLPINLLTLGLFTFVINAIMLKATAGLMGDHFNIHGFWPALLGAIIMAIVGGLLNWLVKDAWERRGED